MRRNGCTGETFMCCDIVCRFLFDIKFNPLSRYSITLLSRAWVRRTDHTPAIWDPVRLQRPALSLIFSKPEDPEQNV